MSACNDPPGSVCRTEDESLRCSDLEGCEEHRSPRPGCEEHRSPRPGCEEHRSLRLSSSLLTAPTPHTDISSERSSFLKVLADAEGAATAAAIQVVSFKDAMEDELDESKPAAADRRRFARQRGLLLEKLEDFKRVNKTVRQKLKQLQDSEADWIKTNHQIDALKNKITEVESVNESLRKDVTAAERKVEDLAELRREEQERTKTALNLTKSVDGTRAHLQGQLRNKEAENNRLTVQLRTLERTLFEQKMEIEDLNHHISALRKNGEKDKESLQKACKAQKLRAEKFEAAIEKCYDEMKDKELQLTSARLELDSRRRNKWELRNETEKVLAHVELLKSEVSELTAKLQREKEEHVVAAETLIERVRKLTAENGELSVSNAALEASVRKLEQQLADCESALVEETVLSQEKKLQVERGQYQVAELQAEIDNLKIKYASFSRETRLDQNEKDVEVQKLRRELQDCSQGLKSYAELLRASEKSLYECRENLQRSQRKCSEKTETFRQLQAKMDSHTKFLSSSMDMRQAMHRASLHLQDKVDSLHEQMEKLRQENLELVRKLASQEEALGRSNRQLEQQTTECQALTRQLESALFDVKRQVNKVKEQAVSKEEVLQTKILELEAEKSHRDHEIRLLHQGKNMAEKEFEVRLKDLQLSLDQSESHKQSVQNYVDFLKNFYTTVFDERLHAVRSISSHVPK